MKTKILLIVVLLAFGVNAIPSYSPYKIYQQTDFLTHANLDSNLLRGSDWSVKLVDTLEKKFIRFDDVKDSTFQRINADTVIVDTLHITGNAKIDGVLNATADSASGALRLGGLTKAYYDTVGNGGTQTALDGKEPAFSKNAGFNPTQNVNSTSSPTFAGLAIDAAMISSLSLGSARIEGWSDNYVNLTSPSVTYVSANVYMDRSSGFDIWRTITEGPSAIFSVNKTGELQLLKMASQPAETNITPILLATYPYTVWHAGNLTPAAIGAEPAFTKNAGFNPTQALNSTSSPTFAGVTVGPAFFGESSSFSNHAYFGRSDFNTQFGYGFLQSPVGATYMNAPTGQSVYFMNNGEEIASIDNTGLDVAVGTLSVGNKTVYHSGNLTPAAIGAADSSTGTFPCTLKTSDVTVQQIGTAYYAKIGNTVTISFPHLYGTSNSNKLRIFCDILYNPVQQTIGDPTDYKSLTGMNSSVATQCYVALPDITGFITVYMYGGVFTTSGNKGIYPFSVSYITGD